MRELISFWPSEEALGSVIASQAEGLTQEAFLAVHQPMSFQRRDHGLADSTSRNETDLIEFLLRDSGDGCVITVVLGRSGVGKSHAVRWLYETIYAREDSDNYVLVWVPRTRSAKGVLRDLLELPGFGGDEWDDLRTRVGAATDGLSVARAARLLQAEMVLGLQSPPPQDLPVAVRDFIEQAGKPFADFIQDPNVWSIPADSEIERRGTGAPELSPWIRLARQVVQGEVDPDDIGARRFLPTDLDFPIEVGENIGSGAIAFWQLLQTHGGLLGGITLRQGALEVLNHLLDSAKAAVLGVNQTPISELFIQLRERLYADHKELVLLIEDMTVMSGLQRSLLDVMVQPAGALTGRPLCPIRTALALTPGWMQGGALPDNVMTRAVFEWWVEEDIEESQILKQYEGLAAGYLNAARHVTNGEKPSRELFDVDSEDDAEVIEGIKAFGKHRASGRPLFPFNRAAIGVLARERVHENGRLIYNPRRFLNRVLQPLVSRRDEFEQGRFPEDGGDLPVLKSTRVSSSLRASASGDQAVRLETVVATWGGQPSSFDEVVKIPAPLFRAFGLIPPDGTTDRIAPPEEDPAGHGGEELRDPDEARVRDPIEDWVLMVEEWGANGSYQLDQRVANAVRKAVAALLLQVLPRDWPGLPSLAEGELRKRVYIHSALGNGQFTPETAIVSLPVSKPPRSRARWRPFVSEVVALLRWHKSGTADLDYFGATESLPALLSLADRVAHEAAGRLRASLGPSAAGERLEHAANLMLLSAQASGGKTGGALEGRLTTLFSTPTVNLLPVAMPEEVKTAVRALANATGERGGAREFLLRQFGAFQGTGSTAHAIDAAGLLGVLSGVGPDIPTRSSLNGVQAGLAEELLPAIREVRMWYEGPFANEVNDFTSWFGADSPKALRDEALELAGQALEQGLAAREARAVREACDGLDAGAARSTVSALGSFGEWVPSTLAGLYSIDWKELRAWQGFKVKTAAFLETLERAIGHRNTTGGAKVDDGILEAFEAKLDLVSRTIEG